MVHWEFLLLRIHCQPYRDSGDVITSVEKPGGAVENLGVDAREKLPGDDQPDDGKIAHLRAQLLQLQCTVFGHEEAEDAVPIERRERDQVKQPEQNIEGEKDAEDGGDPIGGAST